MENKTSKPKEIREQEALVDVLDVLAPKGKEKTDRLNEIFSQLPIHDLDYCKSYYTEQLNFESKYLQNRARRILGLIEEAEQILKPKEGVVVEQPEHLVEKAQPEVVSGVESKEKETETQAVVEKKQEEELKNSLSKEELSEVLKEMTSSIPEAFEPEKTKTDVGLFLRNQTVKEASGLEISEKMKRIVQKLRRGALLLTGVVVLWSSASGENSLKASHTIPGNVDGKISAISEATLEKNIAKSPKNFIHLETYYKLPLKCRKIYLYASSLGSNYVIVDKPTATMFVIGKDAKLIGSFPVLLGKVKGETPNMSDPNSDIAGPRATTPAGKYTIGRSMLPSNWIREYEGRIFRISGTSSLAIHETYRGELKERTAALNSPTVEDNRKSWGCINVSQEMFDKYLSENVPDSATLFITPDDESLSLNPEMGTLEGRHLAESQQLKTLPKTNV